MSRWAQVPLGEVAEHRKEFIEIDDEVLYNRCRVQTSARGVVLRDRTFGADIKTKLQQVCRQGEFLVAEIDAKAGGFGLVPEELDGAIVSSHYFLFNLNEGLIDRCYMHWYSQTQKFFGQVQAVGSTNYAAVRPSHILNYMLDLPPLPEQQRIVARLDAAAAATAARARAAEAMERELAATLRAAFGRLTADAPTRPMGEVAPLVRRPVEINLDAVYPELGVRSFGRGTFHKPDLPGIEIGSKKLFHIESGDLVFNIVFAWEGAVAVASPEDAGRVGSHRFLTCVPDPKLTTAAFLNFWCSTEDGLQALGRASPGGAGRNRTLGLKVLQAIPVRVPSLDAQLWFDRLQAKARAAQAAQAAAGTEIDRLLPSLLHEVFGG